MIDRGNCHGGRVPPVRDPLPTRIHPPTHETTMKTTATTLVRSEPRRLVPVLLPLLVLVGCAETPPATAPLETADAAALYGAPVAASTADALLKAVRRATARYHSATLAASAGYEATDFCVPQMGFHWLNPSLVDPVFDPVHPEVMIYAPGPNGQPKLVAVEYIVIDVGQARPSFGDRPFDIGGTPVPAPHWSQHVWLYLDNPDLLLTAFNPAVTCP